MLDLKFIREHKDTVKRAVHDKGLTVSIDELLEVDGRVRALIQEIDELRHEQNARSKRTPSPDERKKLKTLSTRLGAKEQELRTSLERRKQLELLVPNIPSKDSPVGPDAGANTVIKTVGKIPKFSFPAKDHIALGRSLDLLDLEAGARVSGFRGYYLKNAGVRMHLGLMWLALETVADHDFSLMMPPTIVREFALVGSGHFPFGKEEIYQIANPGRLADGSEERARAYLVGTAEPSLLAYYAQSTLDESQLPIALAGFSPCYRSEVGSYGKETKGLYRIHEFLKVEQVVITPAEEGIAQKWFEKILGIAEEILQKLDLPYRLVNTSTGDMGAGKVKMVDIETWMPSRNDYGETHSNSFLGDWQSRRLGIRYRAKDGKTRYAYTLNNTALASPRILVALWENFQQNDGSIRVPSVLKRYVGCDRIAPVAHET